MKLAILAMVFFTVLVVVSPAYSQTNTSPCVPSGRWQVKTLTDKTITEVDFSHIHKVTIKQLQSSGTPGDLPEDERLPGIEWILLQLDGIYEKTHVPEAGGDGDYHVELKTTSGRVINIEFPNTDCIPDTPLGHKNEMKQALQDLLKLCPREMCKGRVVRATGIGFWDGKRMELHPVLSFELAP